MSVSLDELHVLVVDCQASGATPMHGDVLELGWGLTCAAALHGTHAAWVRPSTDRPVSAAVRRLTGWDEAALEESVEPLAAWSNLREEYFTAAARAAEAGCVVKAGQVEACPVASGVTDGGVPTVVHFARFELKFLRDLHARSDAAQAPFPLDVVCLHAIAERLFPALPRRSIRALAGHLGHSPSILRRASGHVDATAFIWRACVPRLAEHGVGEWKELKAWLDTPPSRAPRVRAFPLLASRRRSVPEGPGVYRFLRPNGAVLYVGKAASLKQRVASHFSFARATERSLEMLSQAHDVQFETTATPLEAALLEADEIKRLDPPYNVQLRTADRAAFFATADWSSSSSFDGLHRVGPLPSRGAISALAAMRALLVDDAPSGSPEALRAGALGVPTSRAPEATLFDPVWRAFVAGELRRDGPVSTRLLHAGARVVVEGRPEAEGGDAPDGWDEATVREALLRNLVEQVRLVRRARLLSLLAHARVRYREPEAAVGRVLVVQAGAVVAAVDEHATLARPFAGVPPRAARLAVFDAATYDRMRVLATELRRVATSGGEVTILVGRHRVPFPGGGSRAKHE